MSEADELAQLAGYIRLCRNCELALGRTHAVPGEGTPHARIMFVGEGPGAVEDETGRPFVGPAGQFLDSMLADIGLRRAEVFIANITKCRPPGNRDPLPEEIHAVPPVAARANPPYSPPRHLHAGPLRHECAHRPLSANQQSARHPGGASTTSFTSPSTTPPPPCTSSHCATRSSPICASAWGRIVIDDSVKESAELAPGLLQQLDLARNWFYLALVLLLLAALLAPGLGRGISGLGITSYLVAFAFLLNGFTLSTESLRENLHHWYVAVPAVLIAFGLSPVLALVMRQVIPGGQAPVWVGFQMVAAVPTMLVSAVIITRMAGGNGTVALYLTVTTNLLAIIVIPPLLLFTLRLSGVNLWGTSGNLLLTVLLPTVVGQLANRRWPRLALAHARPIGIVSQCVILLFIVIGAAQLPHTHQAVRLPLPIVILASLVHHLLLLLSGQATGKLLRLDLPTRYALGFCASQKFDSHHHPALAKRFRAPRPCSLVLPHCPGSFTMWANSSSTACSRNIWRQPGGKGNTETRRYGDMETWRGFFVLIL